MSEWSERWRQSWQRLAEGWQHLWQRASQALTRFHLPAPRQGEVETVEERLERQAPRWGLLAAEVEETAEAVIVRVEIPGLSREDLEVAVLDGHLVVRGERRMERRQEHGRFHLMEVAYGAFERWIPLPAEVDEDRAQARYRDGVLTVTLPKLHASGGPRRIPVESA